MPPHNAPERKASMMSPVSRTVALLQTQDEGYRAYLDGLQIPECPHTGASADAVEHRTAWVRGYAAARTDRARANQAAASQE